MLQLNKLFIFEVDLGSRHNKPTTVKKQWSGDPQVGKRNKFLWQQHCTG